MNSALFNNAIASIRMGVEDYKLKEDARYISAVRNLYAGVLLLAKEALVRAVPNENPELILGVGFKQAPDGNGGIRFKKFGKKTIDFNGLITRAIDFHIPLDKNLLEDLNQIRNDMEHLYSQHPEEKIRAAISKGVVVVAKLLRYLGEEPDTLLGEEPYKILGEDWKTMLRIKDVYDEERAAVRKSFKNIYWFTDEISEEHIVCPNCHSELVQQLNIENTIQSDIKFHCRSCGNDLNYDDVIDCAIDTKFGAGALHRAVKDGDSIPLHTCPMCSKQTLLETEDENCLVCVSCGESLEYRSECLYCNNLMSVDEFLESDPIGVCGYCEYKAARAELE